MGRKDDEVHHNPNCGESSDEHSSDEYNEDEEAYIVRVYGSVGTQQQASSPKRSRTSRNSAGRGGTLRRFSKQLSKEFERRRSSVGEIVEEVRPKTPAGWTIFLSAVCASVLGYEVNLQRKLTAPPAVFAQCANSDTMREEDLFGLEKAKTLQASQET